MPGEGPHVRWGRGVAEKEEGGLLDSMFFLPDA